MYDIGIMITLIAMTIASISLGLQIASYINESTKNNRQSDKR